MHSAQDAIAAIYSFLQQHGTFLGQAGAPGKQAVCSAADAMIASLQVSLSLSACCKNPCLHAHRRCHSCDRQSGLSLLLTRGNLCVGCRSNAWLAASQEICKVSTVAHVTKQADCLQQPLRVWHEISIGTSATAFYVDTKCWNFACQLGIPAWLIPTLRQHFA